MKHHGNYNTQSPFDIGVGIDNREREYVGMAINQLRAKGRNDRRKREKDRARRYKPKKK